jgi:hypothetical protein
MNYHGNIFLGRIYTQLGKFATSNQKDIEREQIHRHKVASSVKGNRTPNKKEAVV